MSTWLLTCTGKQQHFAEKKVEDRHPQAERVLAVLRCRSMHVDFPDTKGCELSVSRTSTLPVRSKDLRQEHEHPREHGVGCTEGRSHEEVTRQTRADEPLTFKNRFYGGQ